jgi:AcrR family transcriptional regulator
MENTKEKILLAALRLFAKDGYEGVSMRIIAEELGITKSALYKHYESKQEIFDSIVTRMKERDRGKANEFDIPVGTLEEATDAQRTAALQKIKAFSLDMFRYWTTDEFASCFRKMLTLEQYRNLEMASLLQQHLMGGVIGYAKDLINEAFIHAGNREKDSEVLALQYFAPIYMMMNLCDAMEDKKASMEMVEKHIDYFMEALK